MGDMVFLLRYVNKEYVALCRRYGVKEIYKFRDWLFNLLVDHLVDSGWVIVIVDFKKSEKAGERDYLGLTDYYNEIIFLDKDNGTPRVLVHEKSVLFLVFFLGIFFS